MADVSGLIKLDLIALRNGECVSAVNAALERVLRDISARPEIGKERQVLLEINIKPPDEGEGVKVAGIGYRVSEKLPPNSLQMTKALMQNGALYVSPIADEDPQQKLIPFPVNGQ